MHAMALDPEETINTKHHQHHHHQQQQQQQQGIGRGACELPLVKSI